jgi:hypothetical protein
MTPSPVRFRRVILGITIAAASVSWVLLSAAQAEDKPERFTAVSVNPNARSEVASATQVEIVVTRWSSPEERARLLGVLREKGPDQLLDTLQAAPEVGYIRRATGLGWALHYARRTTMPDGTEQITLATDRPVSLAESAEQPRTLDYPFTVIELRLKSDGKGEGKMTFATKITADKESQAIVLENWDAEPVLLTNVQREHD